MLFRSSVTEAINLVRQIFTTVDVTCYDWCIMKLVASGGPMGSEVPITTCHARKLWKRL